MEPTDSSPRMFGLAKRYLRAYEGADFLAKAKASYTLYLAIALLAADIVPFVLMLFKGLVVAEALFRLVAVAAIFASIALLRSGRARLASDFLVIVTVAVLWGFMYMRPFQHYYELYALAFLLEVTVLMSCLVGMNRALPAYIAGLSYAAILAFYFIRTRAHGLAGEGPKEIESLFFIAMFLGLSGFLGGSMMALVDTFTGIARAEMEKNRSRIEAMGAVIASAREGMAVGDRLLSFVDENGERVRVSERELSSLVEDFARLSQGMDTARQGNLEIAGFVDRVRDQTRSHSEAIHETSAAIEQINATIDSASSGTADKRERIGELRKLTDQGEADMELALAAILKIANSSAAITEVGKIIQKISSQTNLLAMNASIEAAHAGEFGAGFAVVADEIRTLAGQTGINAKEITRTLKEISVEIQHAREVNQKASDGFRVIKSGVGTVNEAMDGVFNALIEIRTGIGEITQAAVGVRDASLDIETAVQAIAERSGGGVTELGSLGDALREHSKAVQSLLASFAGMAEGMKDLKGLGEENLKRIAAVEGAVEAMG